MDSAVVQHHSLKGKGRTDMTRQILALIIVSALAAAPTAVQAQTSLSISAGANAPTGDLGDIADIGYYLAAGLNMNTGGKGSSLGFRLEGAYSDFSRKNGFEDVRVLSGTANLVYNLGKTADSPYLIGGVGAYNGATNSSQDNLGYIGNTVIGLNGGAGLRFPLSGFTTFVEARYHFMLGDAVDGRTYQFIPITFGIVF
jgi:hypothetical protein